MKDFRSLLVWRKAHLLTLDCYKVSGSFPKYELYGLISQMRRCAASIAANIAEGCGKRGNGEFHVILESRPVQPANLNITGYQQKTSNF